MIMKFRYILNLIMFSLLFVSCNKESVNEDDKNMLLEQNLRIASVAQNAYRSPESSRATYTKEYSTTFENGDKLGLIMIDADGNRIENVSYTFTDGNWTNSNVFYSPKIAKVIAYYPYNQDLDKNITTVEELQKSIQLTKDQSSADKFEKMDLLVCEIDDVTENLNITFNHVFSLVTFTAKTTIAIGDKNYDFNLKMENVSFSIGEETYTPCNVNNAYVCLLPVGTELKNEDFRYTYNRVGEGKSIKTLKNTVTTQEGVRYNFDCPSSNGVSATTLCVGDYYCVTEDEQVVIIPGSEVILPEGVTCKGILFHVMDETEWNDFVTNNNLTETSLPGYAGKHGLVVSLSNGNNYGSPVESIALWANCFTGYLSVGNRNISDGYKMTQLLTTNASNNGITFIGLDFHKDETIAGATSWYIPSFNELKYLVRGEDAEIVSGDGLEYLNDQLSKIDGEKITGSIPSITFISDQGFCLMQSDGQENGWHGIPGTEKIRPICAF